MAQDDGQERTEQPTPKRLRDAREKGQVPRSKELNSMALLMAGGGVRGGQVIGESDDTASGPRHEGISPDDVAASFYQNLGIDQIISHDQVFPTGAEEYTLHMRIFLTKVIYKLLTSSFSMVFLMLSPSLMTLSRSKVFI